GRGRLVEPAQDNARFFVESARAIAPNDPEVRRVERRLDDRLLAEARRELAAGNTEAARHWIGVAADSGVDRKELTELTHEAQRVQTATKANDTARLALLFNQRLTQGRVIDPPADSAKFYLTQLLQTDAAHPSAVLARQALANRTLDEATAALR